jgi:hypothetical protein
MCVRHDLPSQDFVFLPQQAAIQNIGNAQFDEASLSENFRAAPPVFHSRGGRDTG